jgi:hypothetical protein
MAAGLVVLSLVAVTGYLALGPAGGKHAASNPAVPTVDAVPAGWTAYTDKATGFRVAYPAGWTVSRRGTITDFRDPRSGTYLRIDHQSPPGATPDGPWYALERPFAAANPGYQRVGITRTVFHGHPAAVWEYTYGSGSNRLHAIDVGMIAGNYGYALNFQTADAVWAQQQSLMRSLENAFQT